VEVNMRRLCTIVVVAAAVATVTITASGSAYAGGTPAPTVSPASVTSQYSSDLQDDMMSGCHARHAHSSVPTNPIDG
jgi:hypothetical protein